MHAEHRILTYLNVSISRLIPYPLTMQFSSNLPDIWGPYFSELPVILICIAHFGYLMLYALCFIMWAPLHINICAPLLLSPFHCLLRCFVLSRPLRTVLERMKKLVNRSWCSLCFEIWGVSSYLVNLKMKGSWRIWRDGTFYRRGFAFFTKCHRVLPTVHFFP